MRRMAVILGVLLAAGAGQGHVRAEATPPTPAPAPSPSPNPALVGPGVAPGKAGAQQEQAPELKVDKPSAEYHLGDSLNISVSGDAGAAAKKELLKTDATHAVTLYLDNVAMKGVPFAALDRGAAGVQLTFTLVRNANDDDNRHAWDALLKKRSAYSSTLPVSLAIGSALPLAVKPPDTITFAVASPAKIIWVTVLALLGFILAFALLLKMCPTMFRDGAAGPYSLGKTQMIFWGLLVFFAVAAVFVVTWNLERIPPQTLTLLGISVGTGLGAALVTKRKQADAAEKTKTLASEQQQLSQSSVAPAPAVQARIDAITKEMADLQPSKTGRFLDDIMSDGNGISFHRVQVVIWTVLLGLFFGFSVASVMSMPEFPESLLILMGISNGTYISLKVPEKP